MTRRSASGSGAKKRTKKKASKKASKKATPKRKATRSRGRKTAQQQHLEEAFRLAMVEGDIDAALVEMRKAKHGSRPGPRSGSDDVTEAEAYSWGYNGLSHTEICGILMVSSDTWRVWRKRRPELQREYDRGKATMVKGLKGKLIAGINGGSEPLLKFALINWSEMAERTHVTSDAPESNVTINFAPQEGADQEEVEKANAIDDAEDPVRFD